MTAYMDLNGVPATGNHWLLTEVLRGTWGFDGFVVSDAQAVHNLRTHGFAADLTDAGARALRAGVDMEMAVGDPAYAHLPEAIEAGLVGRGGARRLRPAGADRQDPDGPARPAVRGRGPGPGGTRRPGPSRGGPAGRAALRGPAPQRGRPAAAGQPVLHRGELHRRDRAAGRLPARHPRALGLRLRPGRTVTVLDGIRNRAGQETEVRYAAGIRPAQRVFPSMFDMFANNAPADPEGFDDDAELARAVALARESDVALVVLGEWQNMIGEAASRSSLELPGGQLALLQAVAATGTPVVLLVMTAARSTCAGPRSTSRPSRHLVPGNQGGAAVADLIFGDARRAGSFRSPGRGPSARSRSLHSHTVSHDPANQGRRYWDEESTPLYPFGYGLSYGRFETAT